MIYPNYSINKEILDSVALLGASMNDFSWKTRPNGRCKWTCLIQCFNRAPTRPGPLGMEDSVNSKDMRKPDWQLRMIVCVCANLLLSFFESQGFSLHWNKVPRRPYKSGSQLWRFTHFLVRLHPHRFSFCFPNMLEPINLGLSQEFCSCLPLYGILCHCPSLDFSVTQFLDPRSLPERSLPWPLRFKQS